MVFESVRFFFSPWIAEEILSTLNIISPDFLVEYSIFFSVPGIFLLYFVIEHIVQSQLKWYTKDTAAEVIAFVVAISAGIAAEAIYPPPAEQLLWGFGTLLFLGLAHVRSTVASCSHNISPIDQEQIGERIHPDTPLLQFEELSDNGQEVIRRALDSRTSSCEVFLKYHLPSDFPYPPYEQMGLNEGYYLIHHRGRYYQLWTWYSDSDPGFPSFSDYFHYIRTIR